MSDALVLARSAAWALGDSRRIFVVYVPIAAAGAQLEMVEGLNRSRGTGRAISRRPITCLSSSELAAMKWTMRLESNIGPQTLMVRCSNYFTNLRYPNPVGRTLRLGISTKWRGCVYLRDGHQRARCLESLTCGAEAGAAQSPNKGN
jgi:hypothetical protein